MRIQKTRETVAVLLLILVALVGVLYFIFHPDIIADKVSSDTSDSLYGWKFPAEQFTFVVSNNGQTAASVLRNRSSLPQGLPVRLQVPIINVDTAIEDALITPDGRMDVPTGSVNVAWFALGPRPGQVGSAVIGGHFGIKNNIPFVFYNLDKLVVGDKVYVVNDQGGTLAFVVRSIKIFKRDADASTVFLSNDGLAHLNLVTCEGIWNRVNDSYPLRRVVFTDAVANDGKLVSVLPDFNRILDIGSTGADVIALQTLLEQKGFLKMPTGIAYGFFGTLTQKAIAKYQASAGLPVAGVFDTPTKNSLIKSSKN